MPFLGTISRHFQIVRAAKIRVRMIVWIVIVPHPIDVGPGMDLPIHGIVDACMLQVLNHGIVNLRAQPIGASAIIFQWIVLAVIRGQAFVGLFHFTDVLYQVAVRFLEIRQRAIHEFGRKQINKFSHEPDIARISGNVRMLFSVNPLLIAGPWRDGNIHAAIGKALVEEVIGPLIFGGPRRVVQIPAALRDAGDALSVGADIANR